MNIGRKIKELRKARGITQEQLASSIGISFQAVSKWECGIALPDITLAPTLASYFGVSLDTLFDFKLEEIEKNALEIARRSVKYRGENPEEGRRIIEEGLIKYPDNDILLNNLLYLIDYAENPDETIEIATKLIDSTTKSEVKYDAFRFLAYAYRAKGNMEDARAALEQIPEIYFTRLSEMAFVLTGDEKMNAAQKQKWLSVDEVSAMQCRIAECCIEKGEWQSALAEYERALAVLDAVGAGEAWEPEREYIREQISVVKAEMEESLEE